jgi:hypothetical protein
MQLVSKAKNEHGNYEFLHLIGEHPPFDSTKYNQVKELLPAIGSGPLLKTEQLLNPDGTVSIQQKYYGKTYVDYRSAEYPQIVDQLDAIWKGGAALEEMQARVMAVKAKYPKTG